MNDSDLSFNNIHYNDLKIKYKELEKDIRKLRIENTKKEKENEKLREELNIYRKSSNDSSTNYFWSNEFIERWKKLVENTIMESFDNIFYKNILFVRVINIIVRIVYDYADEKIKEKIKEILICFGYEIKNENEIKIFFHKFKTIIFQDYFKTIIKFSEEIFNKILLNINNQINHLKGQFFTEEEITEIEKDLNSNNIKPFIKELFILSLYMLIHEPQLTISTSLDLRYCYFSKREIVLDGFGKENSVCLIILTPPLLKLNIFFQKLFPIVFICDNPTENMIKQCEERKILNQLFDNQKKIDKYSPNNNNSENKQNINYISSNNTTINTTIYTSNRNYNYIENHNIKKILVNNNCYKTPIDNNLKKKEYIRSKSSTKQNPYFFQNQDKIIQKQIEKSKRNNTISENEFKFNINKKINSINEKLEQNLFNSKNKFSLKNNKKKEKSSKEEKRQINSSQKINKELNLNKSKFLLSKIDKSRNSSTYDLEINNISNEQIIENYNKKLITEQNNNKIPLIKNKINSIDSFSESSQNNITPINTTITENNKIITNINSIIGNNQNKIKTTIRKINNSTNIINNNNFNINIQNFHLRKTASTNYEPSHIFLGKNCNNFIKNNNNQNYNNLKHKNSHSHIDKNINKNFEQIYDNVSYRDSNRDLIKNISYSNDNLNNISQNSIISNHSNKKNKNKEKKNKNITLNKNEINQISNKTNKGNNNKLNLNNNNLNKIYVNSNKKNDYYKTQPIKTENTLKLENNKLSSNRTSNSNNIKNQYFFTNDLKSIGKFFKNDIQKRNKALLGRKIEQVNYDIIQFPNNNKINSPSVKCGSKNKIYNNYYLNNKIANFGNLNKKHHSCSINPIERIKNKK